MSQNSLKNYGQKTKLKGRPRLSEDEKKVKINVGLEPRYVDILKMKSEESGLPVALIAARYIVDGIKNDENVSKATIERSKIMRLEKQLAAITKEIQSLKTE